MLNIRSWFVLEKIFLYHIYYYINDCSTINGKRSNKLKLVYHHLPIIKNQVMKLSYLFFLAFLLLHQLIFTQCVKTPLSANNTSLLNWMPEKRGLPCPPPPPSFSRPTHYNRNSKQRPKTLPPPPPPPPSRGHH